MGDGDNTEILNPENPESRKPRLLKIQNPENPKAGIPKIHITRNPEYKTEKVKNSSKLYFTANLFET